MEHTPYRSTRGEQRNITQFHSDFARFYKDLPNNWFTELWQIQKVLTNDRVNFCEICLMALFLNITVDELTHMELPEKTQQQIFDEEIRKLHEQGLKYPEIAKIMDAPYETVKAIGGGRYGMYHKPHKIPLKSGVKPKNWTQIDEDTLPLVNEAISKLQGDGTTRPKKITVTTVEKMLQLSSKRISLYLPKCLAKIQSHGESQEQYWAREVVWAVNQINNSGAALSWSKIQDLTNMRRRNFEACLLYLDDYADMQIAEMIRQVL